MQKPIERELTLCLEDAGTRLDQALAKHWSDYSRTRLTSWVKEGDILVNGASSSAKYRVNGTEQITLHAVLAVQSDDAPEAIALDVLFEDESLLVINKPAGLSVHPGAGTPSGTLVNALLHHHAGAAQLPRAGLVHRLDKDTTGCLIVAKTLPALTSLTAQLAARDMGREYEAIVVGVPISGGLIDVPIGRDAHHRTRQAVNQSGRAARTHFRVQERFTEYALLRLKLDTGRTHQIRVHLQYAGFPIVGDREYGGRFRKPKCADDVLMEQLRSYPHQALHAFQLSFLHPLTEAPQSVRAPRPAGFQALLAALRANDQALDQDGDDYR